jgi:hypothetical protein
MHTNVTLSTGSDYVLDMLRVRRFPWCSVHVLSVFESQDVTFLFQVPLLTFNLEQPEP